VYNQQTLLTAAGAGYVVRLDNRVGKLTINTDVVIHFKVGTGASPTTPTNAYIPASGATVSTLTLPAGGQMSIGADPGGTGYADATSDPIDWVAIWAVGAGYVRILGH